MKNIAAVLATAVIAMPVLGTAPRTFVSSAGVDTNPCSRTAPCRSFTAALPQTSPGGAIVALDSAGYGPITIAQSVGLIAPQGIYAAITPSSPAQNAITIAGTTASDVVRIEGLSLEGIGNAGITIQSAINSLDVERCAITGFQGVGILFAPSNAGSMSVHSTTIRTTAVGISVNGGHATITACRTDGGTDAYWIVDSMATLSDSQAAENSGYGLYVVGTAQASADRCRFVHNATGIAVGTGSTARISNSVITDNAIGIDNSLGGDVLTLIGDSTYPIRTNVLEENAMAGAFTGTFAAH